MGPRHSSGARKSCAPPEWRGPMRKIMRAILHGHAPNTYYGQWLRAFPRLAHEIRRGQCPRRLSSARPYPQAFGPLSPERQPAPGARGTATTGAARGARLTWRMAARPLPLIGFSNLAARDAMVGASKIARTGNSQSKLLRMRETSC